MPQHDKSPRDEDDKQANIVLQIFGLVAIVGLAVADGFWKLHVPQLVYCFLGGVAIGPENVKKLLPGGE